MAVSSGLYSGLPGSPSDGDLYLPRESYWDYLVYSAAAARWRHLYGGFECRRPVYADFTWVNQGGASVNTAGGGIFLRAPASATANLRMLVQSAPATPYTVDAIILPNMLGTGLGGAGIGFYESSSQKVETFALVDFFSPSPHFAVFRNNSPTTDGTLIVDDSAWVKLLADVILIRITNDGANLIYSWSNNMKDFNVLRSHAVVSFFAGNPDKIVFESSARVANFDVAATLIHWDPVGPATVRRGRHISDYLSSGVRLAKRVIY